MRMVTVTIGAAAFGLALVSGAAVAQIQGPAAPNYGMGGPTTGGTRPSGTPNAQSNPQTAQRSIHNSGLRIERGAFASNCLCVRARPSRSAARTSSGHIPFLRQRHFGMLGFIS
jgi:hypothetical protein